MAAIWDVLNALICAADNDLAWAVVKAANLSVPRLAICPVVRPETWAAVMACTCDVVKASN